MGVFPHPSCHDPCLWNARVTAGSAPEATSPSHFQVQSMHRELAGWGERDSDARKGCNTATSCPGSCGTRGTAGSGDKVSCQLWRPALLSYATDSH